MPTREELTICVDHHGNAKIIDWLGDTVARFYVETCDDDPDILENARAALPKKHKGASLSFDE